MSEPITVITLLLAALNRIDLQAIFDRDPYESRRSALPGARLVKVLVAYQMIHTGKLRGLIRTLTEHLGLQAALGGTVALNTLANGVRERDVGQMVGSSQPEAYAYLSKLLQETSRDGEAERVLITGIQKFPENARLHSFLGSFLSGKQRHPEAMKEFEVALQLQPSYVEARVGLASQQRMLSKYDPTLLDKAIENNKRVLEVDHELPEAHFGLGLCYLNKGYPNQDSKTIDYFRLVGRSFLEATKLRRDYASAYYHRAIAINRYGGPAEEAIECLERARAYLYDRRKVDSLLKIIQSKVSAG
jgi:tetratricopeptide (TPR) repeat protein